MTAQVYWIRSTDHTDIFSEGYVGVSKNAEKRWKYGHKWSFFKNQHENKKFSNAIAKYGWDNLIKTIVLIAEEKYCYEIEKSIRPKKEIGWNIAIGGGKPPITKSRGVDYVSPLKGVPRNTPWMIGRSPSNKGKTHSEQTKQKIANIWKGKKHSYEHVAKRMESRKLTRIAKGQIKQIVVNGKQYESVKVASIVIGIPEATLKYWANRKGVPGKKYKRIFECRYTR